MNNNITGTIVQLNEYPPDKFNVLIPVTTMQVMSNLQRIIVNKVQLDVADPDNSKDIYREKSSGKYAITKVGGMKLAAAANISIVETESGMTDGCKRCVDMARAVGKPKACGTCPARYDVAVTVTIRVPEPSGGFRLMKATKEIDCAAEKESMTEAQYKRFLPHRTAMAESKAFMRALRAALGLAATYSLPELRKPFIIAHVVPNLDAPEIKEAVASNYLQSMGMLFEGAGAPRAALPAAQTTAEVIPDDGADGGYEAGGMPEEPDEEPVEDYLVHLFLSREGYFKKITPQSLRMSGEQKFKEGDSLRQYFEAANSTELLLFTDKCQVYKTRASEFGETKASALGDYLPAKLGMDAGENVIWLCLPGDYSGSVVFFFENGRAARVALSAYATVSNRRKLTGAYCDKFPLVCAVHLTEDTELALETNEPRALLVHTALLAPKTTRSTQGVQVMNIKPKYRLEKVLPAVECGIVNGARYRTRTIPAAGALLKPEDSEEKQLELL